MDPTHSNNSLKDRRVDPSMSNNGAIVGSSGRGAVEITKLLMMDSRVDPSDRDNMALRLAVARGYTKVVKELLRDPRVNSRESNDALALPACWNGDFEIARLLDNGFGMAHFLERDHLEIVQDILEDWTVDATNRLFTTPLIHDLNGMIRNGELETIKFLVPNFVPYEHIMLMKAVEKSQEDIVKYFLTFPGINLSQAQNSLLITAIKNDNVRIVRMLRKSNVDFRTSGRFRVY